MDKIWQRDFLHSGSENLKQLIHFSFISSTSYSKNFGSQFIPSKKHFHIPNRMALMPLLWISHVVLLLWTWPWTKDRTSSEGCVGPSPEMSLGLGPSGVRKRRNDGTRNTCEGLKAELGLRLLEMGVKEQYGSPAGAHLSVFPHLLLWIRTPSELVAPSLGK